MRFHANALRAAVLAAGAATIVTGAQAAEFRLTIVSGNAPAFTPIGSAIDAYIPAVNRAVAAAGHKINWVQGFSGQIVKVREELEGVETGLGDVGVIPGAFYQDKLSLVQIGYVTPFTSSDVEVVTEGMNKLLATFPEIGRQGERFNQLILKVSGVADDYGLWAKRDIKRFDDLKGMKVGAVGANQPWVTAAGASPVAVELATSYNALKSGVFEAIVLWQQAMAGFKFCEVAPYRLDTRFGAISNTMISVNKNSWAKLPAPVQAALRSGTNDWATTNDKRLKEGAVKGAELCEKSYNQKTNALSNEDRRKWAFALPNVAKSWAKRQDDAGMPGTKILTTFMDFMRDKKQPVVRNWDKE